MHAIKIEKASADARPAFVLEDVEGAEFGRIKAAADVGVPTFSLRGVKEFSVYRSRPMKDTELAVVERAEI
jgi:hypothetical protein